MEKLPTHAGMLELIEAVNALIERANAEDGQKTARKVHAGGPKP